MKVPIGWLRDYVSFDATAEELAGKLTLSGMEVESIETVDHLCEGVVAADVVGIEPHPSADRLRVCRVDAGDAERNVVCGAENFAVGNKVPYAGNGAVLPNGQRIESAEIRGVASDGMLCAADDLGLSDDHSGIVLLPRDTRPGTPFSELMGPSDTVLEIEVTWNRPDCLSMIGVAREVAALYGAGLTLPPVDFVEGGEPVQKSAKVSVEDAIGCPRYTARILSGVKLGPSPLWMQRRLSMCGVRPINNVVDVTNYVMLEAGHPLHAFDHAHLSGKEIVVRRARCGEEISALDGVTRRLTADTLVIADAARPVAIAGVMGGVGSEIGDSTETVLLESACFDPASIHATSCRLGLATESSHRFERGVDVGRVAWASRRASHLLVEVAGATVAPGVVDVCPAPPEERRIPLRFGKARSLIGVAITDEEMVEILESLQIPVMECMPDSCVALAPGFRRDLEAEADLIEEIARMHGLDDVAAKNPSVRVVAGASDLPERSVASCRAALIGLGLSEIVNYSFASEQLLDKFNSPGAAAGVVLPNPVSVDQGIMRGSLAPQMVETLGRNLARGVRDAALFEMGRVFSRDEGGASLEEQHVAVGLLGSPGRSGLGMSDPVEPCEMFLWAKGIVESLCRAQHVANTAFVPTDVPWAEAGCAVSAQCDGRSFGVVALLSEGIRADWRMARPVALAELELAPLVASAFAPRELLPVPVYPAVCRDLAVIVPQDTRHEDLVRVIRASAPAELTDLRLFDIFTGEGVGEAMKSLAYAFTYRSFTRTLTDEEVNGYHDSVKESIRTELNAEIREN